MMLSIDARIGDLVRDRSQPQIARWQGAFSILKVYYRTKSQLLSTRDRADRALTGQPQKEAPPEYEVFRQILRCATSVHGANGRLASGDVTEF
jgi:hypothetical protein